ncbi:prostacyclin receptor [Stegostoma tigrinum]|uniref:prostacyclin receptor n=1 Tax=Stegostoma tigrinum TaxID=3053191 RepID=UPI00202AC727|nr:prostacyclin receptor [Stegostoma tigrinum]
MADSLGLERMDNSSCKKTTQILENSQPVVSIVMFTAGVVGNVLALALLGVHRKELRTKSSVFCILVTGLAVTDLMGTCCLSPMVFVAYAQGRSLLGLAGGSGLCSFFSSAMTFFGLASTLLLFAMAAERCLAISHPYLYPQHVGRSRAKLALPIIYIFAGLFCLLPVVGFGQHKQYCPGTWCFLQMESSSWAVVGFSLLYASLTALLVLAVVLCNASVIISLCKMHRSQRTRRGSVLSSQRKARRRSIFGQREEEVDHLILLVSMTAIFAICSLPLTIRGFINAIRPDNDDEKDLMAFRFYALNPIVDPWLFIILRKSVFRNIQRILCCRFSMPLRNNTFQEPLKQQSISLC